METITISEFVQHTSKYMKDGKFTLTKFGKPVFLVDIEALPEQVIMEDGVVTEKVKDGTPLWCKCKHEGCTRKGISDNGYCYDHWQGRRKNGKDNS